MLNAATYGMKVPGAILSRSFSDRGDVWPTAMPALGSGAQGKGDFGAISEGLLAGTLVATELGWHPAEDLQPGDRVVTFDNGMRPVRRVEVSTLWTTEHHAPRATWPLLVPAGVLGNRSAITLLPEQAVLIESDEGEDMFGDPFSLVAAGALNGFKGIERIPPMREMKIVTLVFDQDEVVYANGTLLVHCPKPATQRVGSAEALINAGNNRYQRLPRAQSAALVRALTAV
jgi:hypothetical protein